MEIIKIKSTEVLICGAGPVGLLAACLLGKYQIETILIEKHAKPYNNPRAIALDDETLRILKSIDLAEELKKIAKKATGLQLCSPKGKILFTLTKRAISSKDASFLFYSPALEELLREKIKDYNTVKTYFGVELIEIEKKLGKTVAQLNVKGDIHTLQIEYLLACDGANSQIREWGKFGWHSFNYTASNLKVDVTLHKEKHYTNYIKKYIGSKGNAFVFLDSWKKHKRVEFSLNNGKVSIDNYLERLPSILQTKEFSILHQAVYQFKSGVAKIWYKSNIALAGDAAHLMPPYIGQGMCAGFRDIHNFCFKLLLVKQLGFKERLLHSYQQERKPHTSFVIFLTIITGLFFTSKLRHALLILGKLLPNTWLHFEAPPIRLKKGFFIRGKLSGHLFPEGMVKKRSGKIDISDNLLQPKMNMVIFVQNQIDYESILEDAAVKLYLQNLEIATIVIHLKSYQKNLEVSEVIDLGTFTKWQKKHRHHVFLLRPDYYIFNSYSLSHKDTPQQITTVRKLLHTLKEWN